MSRDFPPPAGTLPRGIRLRSDWRPGDRDLIVDLHRRGYAGEGLRFAAGFADYVDLTVAEAGLGAPGNASRVWFAERGAEALGCAAMIDRGARGQLRWVVLLPEARGFGLGKALFGAAMDHAAAQGWREVYLETTDGLAASMQMYLADGFAVTRDSEEELWDGPGRMIVMTRRLDKPAPL
ncbi:GNAT family N-acetyltransferase [Hyphomonas sp.]|uniref:GNAT family N-acetyltransferase n=1 Tax=Hyphomonas sp. TaxID=87 RepID=UPI0025C3A42F|nr:GNAT family N-acetyltransferase [Hyphomonas sp.]